MSCLHITGKRRVVTGCPPLRFTSPPVSKSRIAGIEAKAHHANPNIRAAAAADPACPVDLQWTLWDDESSVVRGWLARNPNAHVDVLRSLTRDGSDRVRAYALWHPRTPIEEIKYAAKYDESPEVQAVARVRLENADSYLAAPVQT